MTEPEHDATQHMSQDPVSQDLMSQDLNEQFAPATQSTASPEILTQQLPPAPEPAETRFLKSILFGPHGLRVGWSVVLFFVLSLICMGVLGLIVGLLLHGSMQGKPGEMSPLTSVIQEAVAIPGSLWCGADLRFDREAPRAGL